MNSYNLVSVGSSQPTSASTSLSIDTYDTSQKIYITAVNVNGVQYNNVVIKLNNFSVISVGSSQPVIVSDSWTTPLTRDQYNAIAVGMTMNQVEQLLGCKYVPSNQAGQAGQIAENQGAQVLSGCKYVPPLTSPVGNLVANNFLGPQSWDGGREGSICIEIYFDATDSVVISDQDGIFKNYTLKPYLIE